MFEKRLLFVLIVAVIFKSTYQQFQRSVPGCTANGQRFCWSCSTAASCVSSAGVVKQYNTTCTGATPVCGLDSSTTPKYVCISNAVADCTCTGTGLSYIPDPYNDQWYILCSGSTASYIDCGQGNFYNSETHRCGTTPPATTTTTTPAPSICVVNGPGVYNDEPSTCAGYYICTSSTADPILDTCTAPNGYFNPVTNNCEVPQPRFQCSVGKLGTFADPFDCRRYYVCFDTELLDVGCCNTTQIFIEALEACTNGPAPEGCPLSDECAS